MVSDFFSEWNPFNIFGDEVRIEDLISAPLQQNETLVQSNCGRCRRIKAPYQDSTRWDKFIYWVRTHLNQRGHLEAIDKLLALFQEMVLQDPPLAIEHLEKFDRHVEVLASLKNDYAFVYLQQGDPSRIDHKLHAVQKMAYLIFEYCYRQQALEDEKKRKIAFLNFREIIERTIDDLARQFLVGLKYDRCLMVVSPEWLHDLFEERVLSMHVRLKVIQWLNNEINAMEKTHHGKFTIPRINDYLSALRRRLLCEFKKVVIEAEIMIENVMINFRIFPNNDAARAILQAIGISPLATKESAIELHFSEGTVDDGIKNLDSLLLTAGGL